MGEDTGLDQIIIFPFACWYLWNGRKWLLFNREEKTKTKVKPDDEEHKVIDLFHVFILVKTIGVWFKDNINKD